MNQLPDNDVKVGSDDMTSNPEAVTFEKFVSEVNFMGNIHVLLKHP